VSSSQDLILSDASDDYLGDDKNSATSLWSEGSKSWLFTSLRKGRGISKIWSVNIKMLNGSFS